MKIKVYDLVKELLTDNLELRNSDKLLIWRVWSELGFVMNNGISFANYVKTPRAETIRRCRQKIQELNPGLQATEWVQKARSEKAEERGTHIFREIVGVQEKFI